jgi:hypothetical protein
VLDDSVSRCLASQPLCLELIAPVTGPNAVYGRFGTSEWPHLRHFSRIFNLPIAARIRQPIRVGAYGPHIARGGKGRMKPAHRDCPDGIMQDQAHHMGRAVSVKEPQPARKRGLIAGLRGPRCEPQGGCADQATKSRTGDSVAPPDDLGDCLKAPYSRLRYEIGHMLPRKGKCVRHHQPHHPKSES